MIYFIGCSALNAVKIGYFTTPDYLSDIAAAYQRFHTIQTGCPLELELLAVTAGGPAEEEALHDRFASVRLRGEWFALTAELRGHISQHPRPERLRKGRKPRPVAL